MQSHHPLILVCTFFICRVSFNSVSVWDTCRVESACERTLLLFATGLLLYLIYGLGELQSAFPLLSMLAVHPQPCCVNTPAQFTLYPVNTHTPLILLPSGIRVRAYTSTQYACGLASVFYLGFGCPLSTTQTPHKLPHVHYPYTMQVTPTSLPRHQYS